MENAKTQKSNIRGRRWREKMRNDHEKWKTLCIKEAERKREQRKKLMLTNDSEKIKERKERERIRQRRYRQKKKNEELQTTTTATTNYKPTIQTNTSNRCRLCRNSCQDSIRLRDANGQSTEVYNISIKFFHPTFMDIEENVKNTLAVLCMECWHHISSFNNFQQTILLVQGKFLQDVERAKSAGPAEESFIQTGITDQMTYADCTNKFERYGLDISETISKSEVWEDIKYVTPKEEKNSQQEEEFVYINGSVGGGGILQPIRQSAESRVDPRTDISIKIENINLSPPTTSRTYQLNPTDSDMISEEPNMKNIKYVPPKAQLEKLSASTEGTETKFAEDLVDANTLAYDLQETKAIHIKQEEPVEIVDMYVVDELDDDDNDETLHNDDEYGNDKSHSHVEAIHAPITSDNSSDSNQSEKNSCEPTNKETIQKKRKKAAIEFDAMIAQWMPTLKCELCPDSFPTYTLLTNHVWVMHPKTEVSITCCGRVFQTRRWFGEHVNLHLNPQAFQCVICKKSCVSRQMLKSHMVHIHSRDLVKEDGYKCNICGKLFNLPSTMRRHVAVHTKERNHNCSYCERSYKNRSTLSSHIRSTHSEKQEPKSQESSHENPTPK